MIKKIIIKIYKSNNDSNENDINNNLITIKIVVVVVFYTVPMCFTCDEQEE